MSEVKRDTLRQANLVFRGDLSLEITNVQIFPISNANGKLRALCRIVLNDMIQLTHIRIYAGSNGMFVSYPIESSRDGDDFRQVFYPTKKDFREYVENVLLYHYNHLVEEFVK